MTTSIRSLLASMNATCPECDGRGRFNTMGDDEEECESCDGRGNNRERTMVACLNALPHLLAVYEAACAWGDARCEHLGGCDVYDGSHDAECPTLTSDTALYAAITTARKALP